MVATTRGITGDIRSLRRTPGTEARIIAFVEPMVIGLLLNCERNWCLIQIDDRRGWLERGQFYGALETCTRKSRKSCGTLSGRCCFTSAAVGRRT